MFELQRRGVSLGVLILSAGVDISFAGNGYYPDTNQIAKHKNKIKEQELLNVETLCVKHPLTLDKIVRRIEFYEQIKSCETQPMADFNCEPMEDPYAWHIDIDIVMSDRPLHERHYIDRSIGPYNTERRTMHSYRGITKSSHVRLSVGLKR